MRACLKRFGPELYDRTTVLLGLKVRTLKAEVIETLLYRCLTWTLRVEHFAKLRTCLDAHATPRYESGNVLLATTPFTRQHSLTPATAPGPPAMTCSEYTHAHETKEDKSEKGPRVPRKMEKPTRRWKGLSRASSIKNQNGCQAEPVPASVVSRGTHDA